MTRRTPLTITVPTRNRRGRVCSLVQQIVSQLLPGDEVIVSDDASTDGTAEALKDIPGVAVHRHDVGLGMVGNWNYCLGAGSNDWICMVHDDDHLLPSALAAIRRVAAASPSALIAHAEWEGGILGRLSRAVRGPYFRGKHFLAADGVPGLEEVSVSDRLPGADAVLHAEFCPSGVTIHRSIVNRMGGFDPQFKYSADMEYFARVCAAFPSSIIHSPRILKYVRHDQQYSIETWRQSDFLTELEQVERAAIAHAGLDDTRAAVLLDRRLVRDMSHMLRTVRRDPEQVRRIARSLDSRPRLQARERVAARLGIWLGWYPPFLI
jgi:glycosyltransferase involved in cell wall biosynthesis